MLLLIILVIQVSIAHNFMEAFTNALLNSTQANSCIDTLKTIVSNPLASQLSTNFIMYSSHMLNDLGNYEACTATTQSKYALLKMKFNPNFPSLVDLAFCGPIECTLDDYALLKPYLYDAIVWLFNANNISLHTQTMNVSIDKIVFTYPQDDMKITMKLSYGFYITISIIVVLVILAIVSTYMDRSGHELSEKSVLGCWSLEKNFKSLFNTRNPVDENLNVFNGWRVILISWIVVGHSFGDAAIGPSPNYSEIINMIKNSIWMTFITAAAFTVDVFFAISGFLGAMSMTKSYSDPKNRNAKTVLISYAGRMLRLMPLVFVSILIFMFIMPVLFASPINNFWDDYKDRCRRNLWNTILFLNNFFGGENLCINPTWYLANDVQFFFLTPLFVIPYAINRVAGLTITGVTMILSTILQGILISKYELSTSTFKESKGNEFSIYYSKPYCRINTYLIGILVAWMYMSYKDSKYQNKTFDKITNAFKNNMVLRYICYVIGTATMLTLIFLQYFFDHYDTNACLLYTSPSPRDS